MHCDTLSELVEYLRKNSFMFSDERVDLLKRLANEQHPSITLLTCSDSRVDVEYFKIDPLDKIFVVRNIWNTVLSSEWSIEYWVEHLNTPILFILWHTNCWAIKASLEDYDHCSLSIKRELNNIEPAILKVDKSKSFKQQWKDWVIKNLELQLSIAKEKFKNRLESWKLSIIWWILDIDNSFWEGFWKLHIHDIITNNEFCGIDI